MMRGRHGGEAPRGLRRGGFQLLQRLALDARDHSCDSQLDWLISNHDDERGNSQSIYLAPSDYLAANLRKALHRQAELLDLPVDPADPRVGRLIADVANQTVNAVVRAQEASLAAKRDDEHDRAMEALIEERRQAAILAIEKMGRGASSKGRADGSGSF
jgi:hypothetical protein